MRKYLKQLRSEFIKHVIERNLDDFFIEWDNNDLDFEGTADEFHNFTTELARAGYYGRACSVLEKGIEQYSMNTDLLADYLNYGIKCGLSKECEKFYHQLDRINDKKKTWRAFDFSIDYLLFKISEENDDSVIDKLKAEALSLVERFKKALPSEELAYLSEYQIYEATYDKNTGLHKLAEFLNDDKRTAKVAPKCHLKYIDEMLEIGEYEQVVLYANDGAAEAAQEQEGVDTGYFFYALALAKDALWLKADKGKPNVDKEDAMNILRYYQTAYDTLDDNKNAYFKVIAKRYKIISNIAGIDQKLNEWRNCVSTSSDFLRNIHSILE